jgi:predicted DNA-binding transcriptional regulator YafY
VQVNRLFEMVYLLLEKKCVTAGEFAKRFEISVRTVYRDVEMLSSAGIPVYMQKGKGGGISLLPHFVLNKTVLTQDEKEEILSSLHAMNNLTVVQTDTALQKLESLLGDTNADWLEVDFSDWKNHGTEMEIFQVLKPAVIHKKIVEFTYASNHNESVKRIVQPLKLCFKSQAWYLYGYCRLRKDYRFFKLKRIRMLKVLDETFQMKAPQSVFTGTDQYSKEKLVTIELKIAPEMAYRVFDEFDAYCVDEKGSFICSLTMPEGDWLFSYLASYAGRCEILAPEEIKKQIKEKLSEWLLALK